MAKSHQEISGGQKSYWRKEKNEKDVERKLYWNVQQSYCPRFGFCVFKLSLNSKGQLISECPFRVIVWTKMPTKKI